MRKAVVINTFFVLLLLLFSMSTPAKSNVSVCINNLRSDRGDVLILVYNADTGFPSDHKMAFKQFIVKAQNDICEFEIDELPPGNYAISVMHDENRNRKMDFNLLGIPKEGFGFSKDAMGVFGPPNFDDAKFELKEGENRVSLKMRYYSI